MPSPIPADLAERIKARAQDPARRSDAASLGANSVPLEAMLDGLPPIEDPQMRAHVERAQGMLANAMSLFAGLGGGKPAFGVIGPGQSSPGGTVSFSGSAPPEPAPAPAGEARIQAAEAALGFALPDDLRQLYAEVGDGGFGPGEGIYGLDALVAKYREMTEAPVGPQGQVWPARLLPISGADWDLVAIDVDAGQLVFWDVEELADDEEEDPGDARWAASFRAEADSLAAWLARWVDAPTQAESMRAEQEKARAAHRPPSEEALEGFFADNPEYERRLAMFSMTAEERRAIGLPDEGWEDKVWEGFDFDSLNRARLKPGS